VRRTLLRLSLIGLSCIAGIICAGLIVASVRCRDVLGVWFGRGHLLGVTNQRGIYEADLDRALAEISYANGEQDAFPEAVAASAVRDLVANETARLSTAGPVDAKKVNRQLDLLHSQFGDERNWRKRIVGSSLSVASLRRVVRSELQVRQWIELKIAPSLVVSVDECRTFYEAHRERFMRPAFYRASHLFLAAPTGTPEPIVNTKRREIETLSTRLAHGEDFSELAAQISEDEATKKQGGDLGNFSSSRMPADFFLEATKLRVGETSAPIQTKLGFHIIKLTAFDPARAVTFEEAVPAIALELQNQKRLAAVGELKTILVSTAQWPGSRSDR
jgi:parvulin-like peptidyl-prolyl isomerase